MTRKRFVQSMMACALCLLLTGCNMLSYSGGWNISKRQKKSVEAYHKFLQERDLALQQASVPAAPTQTTLSSVSSAAQTQPAMGQSNMPPTAWATGQQIEPVIAPSENAWQQTTTSGEPFTRPVVNYGTQPAMQPELDPTFRKPISRASARPMDVFGSIPNAPAGISGRGESNPQNITRVSFANEGGDFDVALSPDGKSVAFASTRHAKTADIYIKSTNGMAIMQITNDPAHDVTPVFSPDGSKIAFSSDRSGNWDIYIVDIQGGRPVQITSDPTQDLSPSFSPDGKSMVYASYGSQSGAWEMVVVDVQNPSLKRFIGFGLFPKWSPVDNKILFQRARQRGTQWFSIWTVELIKGEATRPTEIIASANAAAITPSWSPDGQHVVFATVVNGVHKAGDNRPPQSDIWMAAIDGTGRTNLTRSRFSNLQPKWSKDGIIYFVSNRGQYGLENIWSIKPERSLQIVNTMDQMAGTSNTMDIPVSELQQAGVTP